MTLIVLDLLCACACNGVRSMQIPPLRLLSSMPYTAFNPIRHTCCTPSTTCPVVWHSQWSVRPFHYMACPMLISCSLPPLMPHTLDLYSAAHKQQHLQHQQRLQLQHKQADCKSFWIGQFGTFCFTIVACALCHTCVTAGSALQLNNSATRVPKCKYSSRPNDENAAI